LQPAARLTPPQQMASDRELRVWVSDRLHDLVGFSDRTTADFILAQAKKVKGSTQALAKHLSAVGLPDNAAVASFCGDLLTRLPSSSAAPSRHAASAAEARALVKRSRAYGLLDDEEGDEAEEEERRRRKAEEQQRAAAGEQQQEGDRSGGGGGGSKSRSEKHIRRSKAAAAADGGGDDEDDPTVVRGSKRSKRRWEEDEEGGGAKGGTRGDDEAVAAARREAELEADQREREEFEAR